MQKLLRVQFAVTRFYKYGERSTWRDACLDQDHGTVTRPGPLDQESSALFINSQCLPQYMYLSESVANRRGGFHLDSFFIAQLTIKYKCHAMSVIKH